MIIPQWSNEFKANYGNAWPDNYVCIDLETTGLDTGADLAVELGYCVVTNRKVTHKYHALLNWLKIVPEALINNKLETVRSILATQGRSFSISVEKMREGIDATIALDAFERTVKTYREQGYLFVGHNVYNFDEKILKSNYRTLRNTDITLFGDNELFDTSLIEKANQVANNARMLPFPGDTLRSYFTRIAQVRLRGIKSNLDQHCAIKYNFEKHGIIKEAMHNATVDAFCCHILMEQFRNQTPTTQETTDADAAVQVGRVRGQRRN